MCHDYFDIYALLKSFGFHIRDKTKKRKKNPFFTVCKDQSTRQKTTGLPGKHLCRVLNLWHTAKVPFFAMCYGIWHTANLPCLPCVVALAHGKVALPPSAVVVAFFLPSVELCTRQRLCRMPDKKSTTKKAFADAWLP